MLESPALSNRLVVGAAFALVACTVVLAQTPAPTKVLESVGPPSNELTLHKWSGALNVPDPVACAVDPQGRVYVSATTRRKAGDLDIREHTMWIPDDVALTSVAEKRAFFHRELAPGKLRGPRGMLMDHNADGSVDWKDLTVPTERIYQLRDADGDGTADKMTVFAEGFNTEVTGIAAGVLYHDGWVYATIAPDLWRLKDTDDDGVADIREVVVHGFGLHIAYAGHDMHGLTVGPDGRIYWSIGDKGLNVTSKEGRHFYHPNEGATLRIEADGSNFEVYTHGNRNVQEPAFDDFGDLLGVDNDADMRGERERFVYLQEGSDSGWRCNYQYMMEESPWMREGFWRPHFPGQGAHLLPPLASYSDGPAGFKHDPGTALSDAQRGIFLLNEFPWGRMKGFRVEHDGASYKMVDKRLVNDGIMGIGSSWHPDGSLMMVDWIGGYPLDELGALWRVDAKAAPNPLRKETHQILAAGFAGRGEAALTKLLAHADQRVRQGAQLELAKRGRKEALLAVALGHGTAGGAGGAGFPGGAGSPSRPGFTGGSSVSSVEKDRADARTSLLARIHGLWGYGQLLRRNAAAASAVLPLLRDADPEIRRQTVKILGDAATTAAKKEGKSLIPLLANPSPRVREIAALALAKFREAAAVAPLFAMAEKDATEPVLRHAVITGLTGCATPEQLTAKQTHPAVPVRLVSVVALRRQGSPAVAEYLRDADPLVVDEAARAIHDDDSIPAALPALARLIEGDARSEFTTRRAINANLRVGTADAAARVLNFALNAAASRDLRKEALTVLRVWKQPPPLDRVDGWARTIETAPIASVLTPRLDALLALSDSDLKTLAIEIMIAHALKAAPAQIAAIVGEADASDSLRAQALRLIGGEQRNDPGFARALDIALAPDAPAALHMAGLELLLPDNPARFVAEARATLKRPSVGERQHAIALLAKAAHPAADAVLGEMADALVAGNIPSVVKLDVVEALRARSSENSAIAAKLKIYSASPAANPTEELTQGGNVELGRNIVVNHLAANCMACHAIESSGGSSVGPNLRTVGSQRDPAYLLEALLNPSAEIATGYGIVNLTLKDKSEVTGTLARETPAAVTVRLFDGTNKTVARDDIATQTPPVSIMPAMSGILQPRELRDVVAYLSSLKGGKRGGRSSQ